LARQNQTSELEEQIWPQIWKKLAEKSGEKNWLKNLEKKLAGKSDTQLLLPTRFPHCSCTPDHHPIYVQ